ncbi:hypothetical protein KAU08_06720 [bacterium]|nr:hypothetical protein [bacterium]
MPENNMDLIEAHKKFAVGLFNKAWEYIDKKDKTDRDFEEMINSAHASAWHWSQIEEHVTDHTRWELSFTISHNQLANVYFLANRPEAALYHGGKSVEYCDKYGIGDFARGFAYECLAKAHHLNGDIDKRNENLKLAEKAADDIKGEDDKKYFLSELNKAPGYSEVH